LRSAVNLWYIFNPHKKESTASRRPTAITNSAIRSKKLLTS
jgi:hypothetical protein